MIPEPSDTDGDVKNRLSWFAGEQWFNLPYLPSFYITARVRFSGL